MIHTAGDFQFIHFSKIHKKEVIFHIGWISLPAQDGNLPIIDKYLVTLRVFSIEEGKLLDTHSYVIAEHNGNWQSGHVRNQLFIPLESDTANLITQRVIESYKETLENLENQDNEFLVKL